MSSRRSVIAALVVVLVVAMVAACDPATPSPSPSSSAGQAVAPSADTASASATAESSETAAPTPTPTPAGPTPVPTPAPWLGYTSARNKYAVSYPPDWIVTPGTAKYADQIDDGAAHYVYVSRDTVKGTASLALTVTHAIATIKKRYQAKLVSSVKARQGGYPGRLLTFTGTDNGRDVYIQELILAKGKVAYFVDMFSDTGNAKADNALFKTIYKTFKPKG